MLKEIKANLRRLIGSKSRVKVYTIMGIAAMILILVSELVSTDKKSENKSQKMSVRTDSATLRTEEYEKKLTDMLSKIKDVGTAEVILSCDGSEEYIYAEDVSSDIALHENNNSEKLQNKIILTERSGVKEPVIKKVMMPRFNGALVICDGGDSITVRERVIKAVSAALDLPISKICVECRIR